MSTLRPFRSLIYAAFLLGTASGCQALHPYRPVPVLARNAETKQPIAGVEVHISYPLAQQYFSPWESIGTTGPDGIARLQAAPYGEAGIMVDVTAHGYLNEQKFLSIQEVQAIARPGWFEDVKKRPASLIVDMFAEPRPTVELIVPAGYHGLIKAKVQIQEQAPCAPAQRNFIYEVPPSGEILVTGPSLFRHLIPPDMRLQYSGNIPTSKQAKGTEFGYWYVKTEAPYHFFLIGTQREFDDYRRSFMSRHILDGAGPGSRPGIGKKNRKGNTPSDADSTTPPPLPPGLFDRSAQDPAPADPAPAGAPLGLFER
jgi:hypothetical protein